MVPALSLLALVSLGSWGALSEDRPVRGPDPDLIRALEERADTDWLAVERGLARAKAGIQAGSGTQVETAGVEILLAGPGMADWGRVIRAKGYAMMGDHRRAVGEMAGLGGEVQELLGWRIQLRLYETGSLGAEQVRRATLSAPAGVRQSLEMELARRATGADRRHALLRAAEAAPWTAEAVTAARELSQGETRSYTENRWIGEIYTRHGNWARGIDGLGRALRDPGLDPTEALTILQWLGQAYIGAGREREAIETLRQGLRMGPSGDADAEIRFQIGRAWLRLGELANAMEESDHLRRLHPRHPRGAELTYLVADRLDAGSPDIAMTLYRAISEMGTGAVQVETATARYVGRRLLGGDRRGALNHAEYLIERAATPRSLASAYFWAGEAFLSMGDRRSATVRFRQAFEADPLGLYGLRAGEKAGVVTLAPGPSSSQDAVRMARTANRRITALRSAGFEEESRVESARAGDLFLTRDPYPLAESWLAEGRTQEAILYGRRIQERSPEPALAWNERLARIVFPLPHRSSLLRNAGASGVDPWLLAGLIRQESMWIEDAVSPAGARGLTQVMPATGREIARELGVRNFEPAMLQDPELSLRFGAHYLGRMLRSRDGAVSEALASYNAGPGRMRSWNGLRGRGTLDALFREEIPFQETRTYTKVVDRNRIIYQYLYRAEPVAWRGETDR